MLNEKEAEQNLKKLIKPLYEHANIEWNREQDRLVKQIIKNIIKASNDTHGTKKLNIKFPHELKKGIF